jgi:MYXO-CTERM domain-containing protein
MAHDPHASSSHDPGGAHVHPALPPVTDEAPDSPMWLPAAGLGLLALAILFVMIRAASGGDAADAASADEAAEEAPAAEAAPAEAAPAPAAAPAH